MNISASSARSGTTSQAGARTCWDAAARRTEPDPMASSVTGRPRIVNSAIGSAPNRTKSTIRPSLRSRRMARPSGGRSFQAPDGVPVGGCSSLGPSLPGLRVDLADRGRHVGNRRPAGRHLGPGVQRTRPARPGRRPWPRGRRGRPDSGRAASRESRRPVRPRLRCRGRGRRGRRTGSSPRPRASPARRPRPGLRPRRRSPAARCAVSRPSERRLTAKLALERTHPGEGEGRLAVVAGDQGEGGDQLGEPLLGGEPGERQDPEPRLRAKRAGTGSTPLGIDAHLLSRVPLVRHRAAGRLGDGDGRVEATQPGPVHPGHQRPTSWCCRGRRCRRRRCRARSVTSATCRGVARAAATSA